MSDALFTLTFINNINLIIINLSMEDIEKQLKKQAEILGDLNL